MIEELNHFGIVVRDLDASLAFYQRAFGAVIVFQSEARTRFCAALIGVAALG